MFTTVHRLTRSALPGLAALALALPSPAVAQDSFTIREAMSAPFPSGLVRSPTGDRVAWVQNDRGSRNVWVAEGPSFRGRQITDYAGDDGQEMGGLQFTPDGAHVLYVRGGASNRRGENPNPTIEPDPASRDTWVVPFAGGEPRMLRSGGVFSPDGRTILFSEGREVHTTPFEGEDAESERLFTIRGGAGSLSWSPSGDRILFTSNRGDHSFIGVFDLESREITYMDPSVDHDRSPVWSPDGEQVAFLRVPNETGPLPFFANREAHPWSIRIGDPDTGETREVWRAKEGHGSVFSGMGGPSLFWGAGDHLVFPWEGSGWRTLYSVPASGGEATPLSPGEYEVQWASFSEDGRHVVFSSNQDDIDRRHIWRAAVDGSGAELLTPGDGVEWEPVQTESGVVVFLASSGTVPAHAEVLVPGERRRWMARGSFPADYPSDAMVEPRQVVFSAADGMQIHAQLFLPEGLREGERRPAMIFFHGGSRRQMLLGFHHRGYYHNAYAMNQFLANQGYVVLAVNYRSGVGYGMEFREAENYGAEGASEYQDVVGAGLYLQNRTDVDPERIGLWGGSYGGYLTAFGLARASDMFAAGVDIHGAHDWNVVINNFVPSYNPGDDPELQQSMFEASPMAYVDTWESPVLFIHGDDDRNVPFSETVDLVEALRAKGDVEFEQLVFPDEVHGFLLHRNWLRAYEESADFLQRKLSPRRPISQ